MTTDPAERFVEVQARHQRLLRELAVLEAREAEKAKRREELRTLLLQNGVNPDEPEKELARLEEEGDKLLAGLEAELDAFEAKLKSTAPPTEESDDALVDFT